MEKKSKAQIKKLVEQLKGEHQEASGHKTHAPDPGKGAKGSKGAGKSGVYRPKI